MLEQITVNEQSSIRIVGESVIYFDPFRIRSAANDADLIFITHDHFDHFSPEDIEKVQKKDTVFIAPKSMEQQMKTAGYTNLVLLSPGETAAAGRYPVEAVAAYNPLKPFHPKHKGFLGYVITVNGQRIYVSGDMDATKEAKQVRCDIALIPIGGMYTMNVKEAADFIHIIRPKTVIPTHYGSVVGKKTDGEAFHKRIDKDIQLVLKLD